MRRIRTWHLAVVLAALTVAAFGPVWGNGFVDMDDEAYITRNPEVLGGWTADGFRWAWTTFYGTYWQPLSWLSLQGDVQLFSSRSPDGAPVPSATAIHVHSMLWHAASAMLLFVTLRRLTAARWQSFFVAALFALHPLRVESVAWAAERKDVLSCFFGILTLWAYARYAEKPGWFRYLGVFGAFGVSLLCKPMLMTLPFALLLLDYWPLGRTPFGPPSAAGASRAPVSPGRLVLEKVPLFALTAGIMGVTLLARARTQGAVPFHILPPGDRLAVAAAGYGWYVLHSFYPVGLAVLYPHPFRNWSAAGVLAGAATLLALTLLCFWQARRRPWLLVGWLWFAGSLAPVSGLALAGEQAWADRFTYWPHVGLLLAVVWGLGEVVARWCVPAAAAGAAALGALGVLTWIQVGYWRDTPTLWERALAVTGENSRAHEGMGIYYLRQGRLDLALAHLSESVRLRPEGPTLRVSLAGTLHRLNREDEAAVHYEEGLRLAPDSVSARHNLGLVRLRQGRPAEAAYCFRSALDSEPEAADSLAGLGEALWRQGKRAEAVQTLKAALGRAPGLAPAWRALGVAYLAQGDPARAVEVLERAVRFEPTLIEAYSDLGVALGRCGRWADAARCQSRAVQMQDRLDHDVQQMGGRPAENERVRQLVLFGCRLGWSLGHCGRRSDADQAYRVALALDARWPEKFAARARALLTAAEGGRDPHQAFELAGQAVEAVAEPTAAMRDALALARTALGQGPGATAP